MRERLLRLLLRLYPRQMRAAHGEEMIDLARRRWRRERARRRRGSTLRFCRFLLADLWRAVPEAYRQRHLWGDPGATTTDDAEFFDSRPRRSETLMSVWNDVRFVARNARRDLGFTTAVVFVLALGIGANVAMFAAVDVILLNEPPYPEPDRLVLAGIDYVNPETGAVDEEGFWSYPKFAVLRDNMTQVDPVAGYTRFPLTLSGRGLPARLEVEIVSPAYFAILDVRPALGTSLPDDATATSSVILSHGLWTTRFGADRSVLGTTLTLEGRQLVIAGVMPPDFRGLTGAADLWIAMQTLPTLENPRRLQMRFSHWFYAIGRLAAGATLESARAEVEGVNRELDAAYRWEGQTHDQRVRLERLTDVRANPTAAAWVSVLMTTVAAVLLVTCANVAGLLVARGSTRGHEMAIRSALGAGRGRLVQLHLAESGVLAALGGLAGLAVAWFGIRALAAAWPNALTRGGRELALFDRAHLSLGAGALLFALAVTLLAAVLFGVLPGLRGSRAGLGDVLRSGSGATSGTRGQSVRSLLAGTQLALATVLLVIAGLVLGSLLRLYSVDLGFAAEGLLTFRYSIPRSSPAAEDPGAFHAGLLERLRARPGVRSASVGCIPLQGCDVVLVTRIVGEPPLGADDTQATRSHYVTEGYFQTLGIPLLRGRGFTAADRRGSPFVAVINETAARTFFAGTDPLGREFAVGLGPFSEGANARIVGIVPDVVHGAIGAPPDSIAYFPARQISDPSGQAIVRTDGDPLAIVDEVRRTLANIDPDLAIHDVVTMQSRLDDALSDTRVVFSILALFAAIAVVLACFGVYAMIAFAVNRRTRELGVRIALGAQGPQIVRLVMSQSVRLTTAAVLVGVVAAAAASRWLEGLLFEIEPIDLTTYAIVAATLAAVALAATWLPARRATRIDPMIALRQDGS